VLDHATVAGRQPAHAVADHGVALLAARVALQTLALGCLDDEVPAVAGDHEAEVERLVVAQSANKASTLAAQMKSLIEMPPTE
jgi:hypothetical protein